MLTWPTPPCSGWGGGRYPILTGPGRYPIREYSQARTGVPPSGTGVPPTRDWGTPPTWDLGTPLERTWDQGKYCGMEMGYPQKGHEASGNIMGIIMGFIIGYLLERTWGQWRYYGILLCYKMPPPPGGGTDKLKI